MEKDERRKHRVTPVLWIILGTCSFLMLWEPVWWVGLACAAVTVIFTSWILKRGDKRTQTIALIGLALAIAAAVAFLVTSGKAA